MKILVTGVPAVGKTTFSIKMAKKYNLKHLDVSNLIKEHKLYDKYLEKYDTYEYIEENVMNYFKNLIKTEKNVIIDTHSPTTFIKINFDYVFYLLADDETLIKRYRMREYNDLKIRENLDSLFFDVIGEQLEDEMNLNFIKVNSGGFIDDNEVITIEDALKIIEK
ncbi:KAD6 [Hepatospora eriocheir]|uniref:KAD6 n=1 Tax=Hepatospora eriocheir TaxID=1081669 RepID=A0A1X0QLE3_9MICR|nr:KAD6 [Hepatospora eriocheir]